MADTKMIMSATDKTREAFDSISNNIANLKKQLNSVKDTDALKAMNDTIKNLEKNLDNGAKAMNKLSKSAKEATATQTLLQKAENLNKKFTIIKKNINTMKTAISNIALPIVAIGKVVATVAKTAFNVVKKLLSSITSAIKSGLSTAFKWIKSALSTLLKWIKSALSKVFDMAKKLVASILTSIKQMISTATKVALAGVAGLVASVVAAVKNYASKEAYQIKLKVKLGDDYDIVMDQYKDLLKYTTASREEVLDLIDNLAGSDKIAHTDLIKWAKTIVAISQITGEQMEPIAEKFLSGDELTKSMIKWGISIEGIKNDTVDIDTALASVEAQFEALAKNSLSQQFANIKNNLASIWEQFGKIFSGPVSKIANKIQQVTENFETMDLDGLRKNIEELWNKIEPKITKVLNLFKVLIYSEEARRQFADGIKAALGDVIDILKNKLYGTIVWVATFTKEMMEYAVTTAFESVKDKQFWADIKDSVGSFAGLITIDNFEIFGKKYSAKNGTVTIDNIFRFDGSVTFTTETKDGKTIVYDEKGNKIKEFDEEGTVIFNYGGKTWKAIEESGTVTFEQMITPWEVVCEWGDNLKASVIKWWNENGLSKLDITGDFKLSEDDSWWKTLKTMVKGLWSSPEFKDLFVRLHDWWTNTAVPTMTTFIKYAGGVIGTAVNNAIANSEALRTILNKVPGINLSDEESYKKAQEIAYAKIEQYLPKELQGDSSILTKDFLNSTAYTYNSKGEKVNTGQTWDRYLRIAAKGNKLALNDTELTDNLNYVGTYTPLKTESYSSYDDVALENYKKVIPNLANFANDLEYLRAFTDNFNALGTEEREKIGNYWGFSDKIIKDGIPKFATGGFVFKPTLGLIGEAGPEAVIPLNKGSVNVKIDADSSFVEAINSAVTQANKNRDSVVNENEVKIADIVLFDGKPFGDWVDYWMDKYEEANAGKDNGENATKTPYKFGSWIYRAFQAISGKTKYGVSDENPKGSNMWKYVFVDTFTTLWDNIKSGWKSFVDDGLLPALDKIGLGIEKAIKKTGSVISSGTSYLADAGAFGDSFGGLIQEFVENADNIHSFFDVIVILAKEVLPWFQKGFEKIGTLFDEAFAIFGNALTYVAEAVGEMLLPILRDLVPLIKVLSDIIIALTPVVQSVLAPIITVICSILRVFASLLDKLMPVIAGLSAVIQWVADAISWTIGSFLNWISKLNIFGWKPLKSLGGNEVTAPRRIKDYYNDIMSAYNTSKENTITTGEYSAANTSSQTASYTGASQIHIYNYFDGSYIVGSGGMRELALIMKNEFENLSYSGQDI